MHSLKRVSPWIACVALLLNMLAMPLSRAMQTPDVRMLLWGGFCSGKSAQTVSPTIAKVLLDLPTRPSQSVMAHGDCCCVGQAALVAVPADDYRHSLPRDTANIRVNHPSRPTLSPRQRWPSLMPRASPNA
ncbi:DUF2946 family protein [Pseudomonas sp. LD120]|uniref:DUF2946 family protein n=1 Tax=Pseudomonas sp. LD120 TaxID=485751 RepID=UPI00135B8D50|nr:DUF2946 domain-containing protein [Pseudomonas sp. LD120]KAF0866585.1 DUF2946 domain-containing protein [Pseudomonas sp. LD120]